jgi:hypothetical protein
MARILSMLSAVMLPLVVFLPTNVAADCPEDDIREVPAGCMGSVAEQMSGVCYSFMGGVCNLHVCYVGGTNECALVFNPAIVVVAGTGQIITCALYAFDEAPEYCF